MTPVDSPCELSMPMSVNPFEGFTYVAPSVLEEMNRPILIHPRSPRKGYIVTKFVLKFFFVF